MDYKAGDVLCGCRLSLLCGEGAYGKVFLAEDPIGRRVAVKIIPNCGRYSQRELDGLKNYKDCNHQNLLKILHIEIHDDVICYTMDAADDLNRGQGEYLPDTLANRLDKFKLLDGKDVSAMLEGLLDGLEELHKKGLVHRDIKPDNILWVNGRPTLADAGLIAHAGQGSLVGTPGFMSPRLLSGEGNPEPSDDFYALGKVIYCALTGNPVTEYPSVPENVTISMDADLGRAYRESCKHPVKSTAEFRKLMTGEKSVSPSSPRTAQPPPERIIREVSIIEKKSKAWILWLLLVILLTGGIAYLLLKESPSVQTKPQPAVSEAATMPEVAVEPSGKTGLKKTGLQDTEYAADLQKRTLAFLEATGYFKENRLNSLLTYHPIDSKEIRERLLYSNENPRLNPDLLPRHTQKMTTETENKLVLLLSEPAYPQMDPMALQDRQKHWHSVRNGSALAIQQEMLRNDTVMQIAAMDQFIRNAVNYFLSRNALTSDDEAHLKEVIALRQELLDPEFGHVLYLGKKNNR